MRVFFLLLMGLFINLTQVQAQQITVSGTVLYNPTLNDCFKIKPCIDAAERTPEEEWVPPPAAVNIAVQGTDRVVKTDSDGNYQVRVSPNASLMFMYVGHNRVEVSVEGRNRIDMKLTPTPIPVIDALIQRIVPQIHSGQRPDIEELAEEVDVNRETARDFIWLVLGNRPFSEMYPDEYIPDYRFEN